MGNMMAMLRELNTVQKQHTKECQQVASGAWSWDSQRSLWLQWSPKSEAWVVNHKPLPQWFIDADGKILASELLRLWKEASSFNDLHQQVFWVPKSELLQLLDHLNLQCQYYGVEAPPQLPMDNLAESLPVSEWLDDGLVEAVKPNDTPTSSVEESAKYDPMQALFEAQKRRLTQGLTDSRPSFQTLEQGKFTAKH